MGASGALRTVAVLALAGVAGENYRDILEVLPPVRARVPFLAKAGRWGIEVRMEQEEGRAWRWTRALIWTWRLPCQIPYLCRRLQVH